jgi:alkylation response protein AidB-like acyl-CoA dehydrogenase
MTTFLVFIGTMNAAGAIVMIGALRSSVSDFVLRRATYLLPADRPFEHSAYSHLWLWWAIVATAVLAALNWVAAGWPPEYAPAIVTADVGAYLAFEALAIAASFSPRYGPGVYVAHVLWLSQAAWGIAVLLG